MKLSVINSRKYDFPIVEGWPPDKDRNMRVYLRPNRNNSFVLRPKFLPDRNITMFDDKVYNKTMILVVCQSAVGNFIRRDIIRRTWGMTKYVPAAVVFLLGTTDDKNAQSQVDEESNVFKG